MIVIIEHGVILLLFRIILFGTFYDFQILRYGKMNNFIVWESDKVDEVNVKNLQKT